MTVTLEPRGLAWINNINMATAGSLVTNLCWFLGSTALTIVACILLLRQDYHLPDGTLVVVEMQRQLGLTLAGFLLGAWTGKTVAGVADAHNKRKAHPAYAAVVEAKERGAVAGAAAATVIAERAADLRQARTVPTGERPAPVVHAEHVEQVTVADESVINGAAPAKPKQGMDDSRTDDERG